MDKVAVPTIVLEDADFGDVLAHMKKIAYTRAYRKGWNGRNIYIELQLANENSKMTLPYLYIVTTNVKSEAEKPPRGLCPWLASQTDMLAEDWVIEEMI